MAGDVTLGDFIRIASNNAVAYKQVGGSVDGADIGDTNAAAGAFKGLRFFNSLSGIIAQYSTAAASGTFAANQLTSAPITVFQSTGSSPGTITTRTLTQMLADIPGDFAGMTYLLRVIHSGSGTLTIAGGSNVTMSGTSAISTTAWRDFVVSISASSMVFQNVGSGTA